MSTTFTTDHILNGQSFPIGSTVQHNGINFCLFSKHATKVTLLLYANKEDKEPYAKIDLDPDLNKTYHYWHVFIEHLQAGQLYAYQIDGPDDKRHSFQSDVVVLDPYAKSVAIPIDFYTSSIVPGNIIGHTPLKSVAVNLKTYDWENDIHPRRPFAKTLIYEMHLAGFTKHPSSGVSEDKRGTYSGLIEKIPYLLELGITAVELLPVFQFDHRLTVEGLVNYWGYNPISFFAIHQGYSSNKEHPLHALDEFRDMVKALHKAGIEVILDVVYNHTAENNKQGPTFSYRGIDNSIYYTLEKDSTEYANYSGCGNTLNANHPIVRRMIIDSLHFWVKHMHVDGFRFDLASILSRDEKGNVFENPPILWDIESDPVLAGTKLIAEAWDAAGLYQVGSFIGDSWQEWNGRFRDDVRSFIRGDRDTLTRFVTRIVGSPDLYESQDREPEQSINFVTCHDGFTLNDLVSYNNKHNDANKENGRDGGNDNYSWNTGVEGPSDDSYVERLRIQQIKNFFTINILSIGAPMIMMGDEIRRTQFGNNNAYCHDVDWNWMDWTLVEKNKEILDFVKRLIRIREKREFISSEITLRELLVMRKITWHGVKLHQPDWSYNSHSIAFTTESIEGSAYLMFIFNAYQNDLHFELPSHIDTHQCSWKRLIDTSEINQDVIALNSSAGYLVKSKSVVVLESR